MKKTTILFFFSILIFSNYILLQPCKALSEFEKNIESHYQELKALSQTDQHQKTLDKIDQFKTNCKMNYEDVRAISKKTKSAILLKKIKNTPETEVQTKISLFSQLLLIHPENKHFQQEYDRYSSGLAKYKIRKHREKENYYATKFKQNISVHYKELTALSKTDEHQKILNKVDEFKKNYQMNYKDVRAIEKKTRIKLLLKKIDNISKDDQGTKKALISQLLLIDPENKRFKKKKRKNSPRNMPRKPFKQTLPSPVKPKPAVSHMPEGPDIKLIEAAKQRRLSDIKSALANGADINAKSAENGCTALWFASLNNHIPAAELLLNKGADVSSNKKSKRGSPLWIASMVGNLKIVKLLLAHGADVNATRNPDGSPALWIASQNGHVDCVKLLLDKGALPDAPRLSDNAPPLWIAAQANNYQVAEILLNKGASADGKRDSDGETALMRLLWSNGDSKIAELLINKGANVNAQHKYDGSSALFLASLFGRTEIVKMLLDKGADVNIKKSPNAYNFMRIAEMVGDTEFVEAYELEGYDIRILGDGLSPLFVAAVQGNMDLVKLLLKNGADPNAKVTINNVDWTILKATTKMKRLDVSRKLVWSRAKMGFREFAYFITGD